MGAAAQLDRIGRRLTAFRSGPAAHGDDAHLLAVFLTEQRERAFCDRVLGAEQPGTDAGIGPDLGVDLGLDRGDVLRGQRTRMAEIETQAIGRDE